MTWWPGGQAAEDPCSPKPRPLSSESMWAHGVLLRPAAGRGCQVTGALAFPWVWGREAAHLARLVLFSLSAFL